MIRHDRVRWSLVAAMAICMPGLAAAAPLVAGGVQLPVAAEVDPVGSTETKATSTVPFNVPGSFSGTLTSTVLSGDTSNPYGGLTFTYRLSSDASSIHNIARISLQGFAGLLTDASYQSTSPGVAPGLVDRSTSSDVVGYYFLPYVGDSRADFMEPGDTSVLMVVQTNSTTYAPSTASLINGGQLTIDALAPQAPPPVPEPASLCVLALGAMGFLGRRR